MRKLLKRLSMQQRMTLVFSLPLILVLTIILQLFFGYAIEEHKRAINQSMEKSVNQAAAFLESTITNMASVGKMIENSGEVRDVLFSEDFSALKDPIEEYYDYYRLRQVMDEMEVTNPSYRLAIYVPDELSFSGNKYFFYGKERLKEREDYLYLHGVLQLGKDYLGKGSARVRTNTLDEKEMVTVFHPIRPRENPFAPFEVCSVSVEEGVFEEIIQNTDITVEGLSYLISSRRECLVSSNEERYEQLRTMKGFPLHGKEVAWEPVNLNTLPYYAIRRTIGEDGDWSLVSLIPLKEYEGHFQRLRFFALLVVIAIMAFIALASNFLSRFYVYRLRRLRHKMMDLQGGDLNAHLPDAGQGDEIEEVYISFNYMVEELKRLLQEHYRLGKSVQSAEIRALQAQINPHFLYNTLDLINWIAMDYGAAEIEKITWNLARFYRLSLNHGKSLITIKEEIEHTQVYVAIQNFHYADALHLKVDIPEELLEYACLNITLQPFVENSIVHGIAEHPEISECHIQLSAKREGEDILFIVADDGPGMTRQQMDQVESLDIKSGNQGYGIKNINFRLKLCFGERYGVSYSGEVGQGTTVAIRIPCLTMEEAERVVV